MKPRSVSLALVAVSLALSFRSAPASSAAIAPRRPTPHERLDSALAPVTAALDELRASEGERRAVQDLISRGETLAAEQVESRQRGEHDRAAGVERAIALLARVVRGRIEALRAEAAADESERRASEGESLARQARGALERAAERRLVAERDAERAQREAAERATSAAAAPATPPTRPATTPARPPRGPAAAPRAGGAR
jgi:hypothetical protein